MATGSYKVILSGQFDGSRERDQIRDALVALFKLSEAEVDRLLDSAPVTIKSDLDYDTAAKYKVAIEQTGALCELREIKDRDAPPMPSPATPAAKAAAPATAVAAPPEAARGPGSSGSPRVNRGVVANRVQPGRGAAWWSEGWRLFMEAPGTWFAIGLIMMLTIILVQIIPLVGLLAAMLLPPLFTGGVMLAAHEQNAGRSARIDHLFAGFSRRTGPLLALGGIYFAASFVLSLVVVALIGGAMLGADMNVGPELDDPAVMLGIIASTTGLLAVLVAMAAGFLLMASLWFAPALVMLRDMPPLAAMKASLVASLRNWLPFLVYGLLMFVFSIIAMLPLGLGYLLLIPVLLASVYAAYLDIFGE